VLASSHSKRADLYDQDENSSLIGDYNWNHPNEQAYDSFHVNNHMESGNWIEVCVDFGDSDGTLDSGVCAVGWNNEHFIFNSQADLDNTLAAAGVN
jgi:hypothetical protein